MYLTGIWTKDLKKKTGLAQTTIAKALKTLEQRELVKSVKSVQHGQRKQYMLFELEPSQDVTGGVWWVLAESHGLLRRLNAACCSE